MRRILSGLILGGLCAALCLSVLRASPAAAASRIDRPFNDGWRLATGEIAGAERPDLDEAFKVDIHDLKGGITWYRKRFVLPPGVGPAVGGKAFLTFEGVRQAGDVYVNGVLAGGHENGVTAFGVDATKALKPAPYVNVV